MKKCYNTNYSYVVEKDKEGNKESEEKSEKEYKNAVSRLTAAFANTTAPIRTIDCNYYFPTPIIHGVYCLF